jgi:hypothetical protein
VLDVIERLGSPRAASAKYRSHLAAFAAWAWRDGVSLDVESLLDADLIERYVTVGMAGTAESTRATRRAILRRIARRVSPSLCELPAPEPIAYRRVRPPYTAKEVDGFWRLTRVQPTEGRRDALSAVLALGLGCGLDCRDMAWVRGTDVDTSPDGTARITVRGGSRPRSVVALQPYTAPLLALSQSRGSNLLIGGSKLGRHNVTSTALARIVTDQSLPRLVVTRLRSTWLLEHLRRGTPLPVLMPAAGLTTVRPLEDLLAFLPVPSDEVCAHWLSGRDQDAVVA